MPTVKAFREDYNTQIEFVLLCGKTSDSLLYKVNSTNKRSNAKIESILSPKSAVTIYDFSVAAAREFLSFARTLELSTNLDEADIRLATENRKRSTSLGYIFPILKRDQQYSDLCSLTVDVLKCLLVRVQEVRAIDIPRHQTIAELLAFFKRDTYLDISMTVGTCVDLGFPTKPIFHDVTDQLIAQMACTEGGWKCPWYGEPTRKTPINAKSKRRYSGFNILWLWQHARSKGFHSNQWASRSAWQQLGGTVASTEVATSVFTFFEIRGQANGFRLGVIPVFNRDQVLGLRNLSSINGANSLEKVDRLVEATNVKIKIGWEACYFPGEDYIEMPPRTAFHTDPTETYYATLLHELVHWTGHKTRKNREIGGGHESDEYAREELVAELGAAFLCAELGIGNSPREDHAQYLNHWISQIRNRRSALLNAAVKAEAAVNFITRRRHKVGSASQEKLLQS